MIITNTLIGRQEMISRYVAGIERIANNEQEKNIAQAFAPWISNPDDSDSQ